MSTIFLWPLSFLFVLLPIGIYFLMPAKQEQPVQVALKVPFFQQVSRSTHFNNSSGSAFWLIVMWGFFVLAAMRPVWYPEHQNMPIKTRNIVLALDASESMREVAFNLQQQRVTRFDLVLHAVDNFLQKRKEDNIALVLFGDEAFTYAPLSYDKKTLQALLKELFPSIVGRMTAMGEGLALGVQNALKIPAESRIVILLSDGYANAGTVSVEEALRLAKKYNVKVYTIGMLSAQKNDIFDFTFSNGADVDEALLKEIANQTGGVYFRAATQDNLNQVYDIIDKLEETEKIDETQKQRCELFYLPLFLGMLCLLVVLMGGRKI